MASSPRAGDLLVYAAYDRDFRTVKAMLSHGVTIRALTIRNGEPRSRLPQLLVTYGPLSFLCRVAQT